MARRSDFAQKLLDDLRLRKERMAASQNSNQSYKVAIDAYSHTKQNYKGFKDTRTSEMTGPRTGNARNNYSGSNKSYFVGEASSQIVPYARGQRSEKLGNLSLALAFALENTGKIRIDSSSGSSMLGFLQQIGTISTGFSKVDRKSTIGRQIPSKSEFDLSIPHIEEISKGTQKLNQILQACSSGINFDRYSIEIGKELLKGAIDLEESLRMLINMQEASEHFISPRKKNRIKLLEDGEDDEDNTVEVAQQWQLDIPKFSFDKPSRQANQELGTDRKQRLPALSEGTNYSHERQRENTFKSVSHRRSASHGSSINSLSTFQEKKIQSSSSESKLEKGRIPNVIAKLMGLDEIPENDNLKTTMQYSVTKQKNERKEFQSYAQDRPNKAGHKTKDTESFEMHNNQKMVEIEKNHVARDFAFSLQTKKGVSAHVSFEEVIYDEKSLWQNLLGEKTEKIQTGPVKPTGKKDKQQTATAQNKQNSGTQMDNKAKERNQDTKNSREYKGTSNVILKEMLHPLQVQAHKRPQSELTLQEKAGFEESKIQIEKRHPKLSPISQLMSQNNQQIQKPFMIVKSEPQQKKNREEEKKQQRAKKNLQVKKQKGSETMSKSLPKPSHDAINLQKKQLNTNQAKLNKNRPSKSNNSIQRDELLDGRYHDNLVGHRGSPELNIYRKDSSNWKPDRNLFPTQSEKKHSEFPLVMRGNPVHETVLQRTKIAKKPNNESPKRINEVTHGGQKDMGHERCCDYEATNHLRVFRSEEPKELTSTLDTPMVDESQDTKEPQFLSLGDRKIQINQTPEQQQNQAPISRDHELKSLIDISHKLSGTNEAFMDILYPSEMKQQKVIKPSKKELLTDSENHLKKILIKSQLFLNTADALFKLDIPISILHASSHDYEDEDSKLVLDCGYELMRRKGKRQEFAAHPCVNISLGFVKIKKFDELIQQLHKDFKKLKFYGRSGKQECDAGEYLPRMLQSDVYNSHPELSCMWDLGWNETMFAFIEVDEVVRDIEKDVLTGLVHEITRDLQLLPK